MDYLLEVNNLKTYFLTDEGEVPAVDGVSFKIKQGETLGIVGESGSGKSITSLSLLQLVPKPHGKIVDGSIYFKGENLLEYSSNQMRKIRGNDISMIFQEPMTSLNPVFTIGDQIMEAIRLHQNLSKKDAYTKTLEMLNRVQIPLPEKRINQYPHQLSGGMRQRVMIAMALACHPDLLIADEPTTALDVTTQAQILELMANLKLEFGTSILLITHDLGVISEVADNVVVMYLGRIVEYSDINSFFENPKHPYSIGLLGSIPDLDLNEKRLNPIPGQVPSPSEVKQGCRFCSRCQDVREICQVKEPELVEVDKQLVRCWKYTDRWDDQTKGDVDVESAFT